METTHRKTTRLGRGEGRKVRVLGEMVAYKVTADMTGGAYSLFEVAAPPGSGPPPHVQHHEDECFYVLEGEFEFLADGETMKAGPGSLVYVPKGSLHTYKNAGSVPGRLLAIHTPGGIHERFFEEIGEEADEPSAANLPPDFERIIAAAARRGIEVPPPPSEGGEEREIGDGR